MVTHVSRAPYSMGDVEMNHHTLAGGVGGCGQDASFPPKSKTGKAQVGSSPCAPRPDSRPQHPMDGRPQTASDPLETMGQSSTGQLLKGHLRKKTTCENPLTRSSRGADKVLQPLQSRHQRAGQQ